MGKLIGFIIVIIFIIFTFLAVYNLYQNSYAIEDVKYVISLSAKALGNCVETTKTNLYGERRGFDKNIYENPVTVDKDKLLIEFYDSLYSNYYDEEVFNKITSDIIAKILVYDDKFYVAGISDKWSPPYFFTKEVGGNIIYLNTSSDVAYYYNASGNKVYSNITSFSITQEEKQQEIIDKLNETVSQLTFDYYRQNGLKIETYNPFKSDGEYIASYSRFNILDGLTFFVVFAENRGIYLDNRELIYKNYNVVGYTMNY